MVWHTRNIWTQRIGWMPVQAEKKIVFVQKFDWNVYIIRCPVAEESKLDLFKKFYRRPMHSCTPFLALVASRKSQNNNNGSVGEITPCGGRIHLRRLRHSSLDVIYWRAKWTESSRQNDKIECRWRSALKNDFLCQPEPKTQGLHIRLLHFLRWKSTASGCETSDKAPAINFRFENEKCVADNDTHGIRPLSSERPTSHKVSMTLANGDDEPISFREASNFVTRKMRWAHIDGKFVLEWLGTTGRYHGPWISVSANESLSIDGCLVGIVASKVI